MADALSPDLLRRVGIALYGPRWQTEMARKRQKSDRIVRYWEAGKPTPPTLPADLRQDIRERIDDLKLLLRELR